MQLSKNIAGELPSRDATRDDSFQQIVMQVDSSRAARLRVVGVTGVEPVTLRLSSACSNQLSYTPVNLVELRRFELLTYSLQSYRSTN